MLVHQGQQRQRDKGDNTSATAQSRSVDGGNNTSAMTVMTPMKREGNEISAIRTTMPAQQGQQCLRNVGNGASTMRAMTPSWQRQRCLCIDDGNEAIVTRARMIPAWRATMPSQQGQQGYCHDGKDA
jgi:hypothetical protein